MSNEIIAAIVGSAIGGGCAITAAVISRPRGYSSADYPAAVSTANLLKPILIGVTAALIGGLALYLMLSQNPFWTTGLKDVESPDVLLIHWDARSRVLRLDAPPPGYLWALQFSGQNNPQIVANGIEVPPIVSVVEVWYLRKEDNVTGPIIPVMTK